MKRSSLFLLGSLAFLVNACEKHPVAELPPEHATAFGEHAWAPGAASKHGDAHPPAAEGHAPAAATDHAKAAASAAPAAHGAAASAPAENAPAAEAPKFFPEKKP